MYRCLFAQHCPDQFSQDYARAHRKLALPEDDATAGLLREMRRRGQSIEPIELFLRRRAPGNLITARCRIVCYLAETSGRHADLFLPRSARPPWLILLQLAMGVLRARILALRGRWLVRRLPF